jgi:hypothetical protein
MRIITDKNVDQLVSMSYSDNYKLLLKTDEPDVSKIISSYTANITSKTNNTIFQIPKESIVTELKTENTEQLPGVTESQEPETPAITSQVAGAETSESFETEPETIVNVFQDIENENGIENDTENDIKIDIKNDINIEKQIENDIKIENQIENQIEKYIPDKLESKTPDFGDTELNNFFAGLSPKAQNMILDIKDLNNQKMLLSKLFDTQKVKPEKVITNMDILNVDEDQPVNNEENVEVEETKKINLN